MLFNVSGLIMEGTGATRSHEVSGTLHTQERPPERLRGKIDLMRTPAGILVQAAFTAPLFFLGTDVTVAIAVMIPALFLGFFGHVTAIVAFMVTATSGMRDAEQGLATGLATLTQQIGCTIGIPILAAVAATQTNLLNGIHLALAVNVLVTLTAAALIWIGLRARREERSSLPAAEPVTM